MRIRHTRTPKHTVDVHPPAPGPWLDPQVAARTSKLTLQLDSRGRTCLASARLDSIYPNLRQLHLLVSPQPGSGAGRAAAHEGLRAFVAASICGQLRCLTLLDLSRCSLLVPHDVWAALVESLGPAVCLRVPWRCLLLASGPAYGSGSSGSGTGTGSVPSLAASPRWAAGGPGPQGHGPPALCACSVCAPALPDSVPVSACLQLLAAARPGCTVELEGRGLPVRSPPALAQLCSISQLAKLSLSVCGVRPLANHAGWLSCLRKLHTLELKYREEGGGSGSEAPALHQVIRSVGDDGDDKLSMCVHACLGRQAGGCV